ncbi:MAG TPA: hypothetical protein VGE07_14695 [Herpetosiphonaceae bacterium]
MTDQTDDRSLDEELAELAGYRSRNDQGMGAIDQSELETLGNHNPTDVYQGEPDPRQELLEPAESLDMLTSTELREGETDDPMEAIEEGLTYVPPIDPPINLNSDARDEVEILNGFGMAADAGPLADGRSLAQIVMARIHQDSATVELAPRVRVRELDPGVIELRGEIADLTDEDLIVGVAESVEGVEEVVSELRYRGTLDLDSE